MTDQVVDWVTANQRYLSGALKAVRLRLDRNPQARVEEDGSEANEIGQLTESEMMPALTVLCVKFGLSPFERDLLLICAGVELDAAFSRLFAEAHADPLRIYPTFGLALAILPDAHWSAITPAAPLRYWRMIELGAGNGVTVSPLHIDERVLHFLTGIGYLDDRLTGLLETIRVTETPALGPDVPVVGEIASLLTPTLTNSENPIILLCGNDNPTKRLVVGRACARLGMSLNLMSTRALSTDPHELNALIRLAEREAILNSGVLFLDCDETDTTDANREAAIVAVIDQVTVPLIVASRDRRSTGHRPAVPFDVPRLTKTEQGATWSQYLGDIGAHFNGHIDQVTAHFNLSLPAIRSASVEVTRTLEAIPDINPENVLWDACRKQARPRLDALAQRIESGAGWRDLVLPDGLMRILQDIVIHVRGRTTVYETWGFAQNSGRGFGITALFAGISGTGKTLAAEVMANELRLDLYRIDLSQVVSKYIGETEKNLRQVFDAADQGGAILLFDEADALFGKRSEVKDSHDRYANIEVSYLLQRMEAYRGLAILTTNLKDSLDTAFIRRIRFIAHFPFPDMPHRAEIWRRIFPAQTPTEGLDVTRLAKLNVTGGSIHNIALYAAFLAADAGEPVRMAHLLRAARVEYAKIEKPLIDAEIGDWL